MISFLMSRRWWNIRHPPILNSNAVKLFSMKCTSGVTSFWNFVQSMIVIRLRSVHNTVFTCSTFLHNKYKEIYNKISKLSPRDVHLTFVFMLYQRKSYLRRGGVSNHRRLDFFVQPFVPAQIRENIKAPRQWPLWVESTGDRWIPLTNNH